MKNKKEGKAPTPKNKTRRKKESKTKDKKRAGLIPAIIMFTAGAVFLAGGACQLAQNIAYIQVIREAPVLDIITYTLSTSAASLSAGSLLIALGYLTIRLVWRKNSCARAEEKETSRSDMEKAIVNKSYIRSPEGERKDTPKKTQMGIYTERKLPSENSNGGAVFLPANSPSRPAEKMQNQKQTPEKPQEHLTKWPENAKEREERELAEIKRELIRRHMLAQKDAQRSRGTARLVEIREPQGALRGASEGEIDLSGIV